MEQNENSTVTMSTQMSAVMTIISACSDLTKNAGPHIDLKLEQINWDLIFKQRWSNCQKTALSWGFILWRDEARPHFNVFENSNLMGEDLQLAVLQAIMIRWGFGRKSIELFSQHANQRRQSTQQNGIDTNENFNYTHGRCS
jgi:hypothetical protein